MSLRSYKRNLERGVTGPYTNTCFAAALDQITRGYGLRPSDYIAYREFTEAHSALSDLEQYRDYYKFGLVFNRLARTLGGYSCDKALFRLPRSKSAFSRLVRAAVAKDCRVVVDLRTSEGLHSAGLVPCHDGKAFRLASTWLPPEFEGELSLGSIFEGLEIPEDLDVTEEYKRDSLPYDDSNVTILPAA
jgi:hypothetical protein